MGIYDQGELNSAVMIRFVEEEASPSKTEKGKNPEVSRELYFKPAGGINTVHDAVVYYTIVKEVLGEKWLTNEWLRLGTSRLTNLLLSELVGKEIKYF